MREKLILTHPTMLPRDLHIEAIQYVKAASQSRIITHLEGELSEEEHYIYKRGRNTKSHTIPKNADVLDYKRASGFEALIGYLYLEGNMKRIIELVSFGLEEEKHEREKEQEGI